MIVGSLIRHGGFHFFRLLGVQDSGVFDAGFGSR